MADYTAVSMGAILRDYIEPKYLNDKHKMMCDIADTLYNNGQCMVELLKPQYKELYNEYGREFWATVLQDMEGIDSQITESNIKYLIEDYDEMLVEHGAM